MQLLWKRFTDALVTRYLRFKVGAKLLIDVAGANTPTQVTLTELAKLSGLTASTAELNITDGLLATAAELNNVADVSTRKVAAGATLALTVAAHDGKIIELDTAAGSVVTLPAATGSGARFEVVVKTLATSNSHKIQVANASDTMKGVVQSVDTDTGDAVAPFAAAAASDTITLNRSTTGSVTIGERFVLVDSAANVWSVEGWFGATGAPATPFSAAV